MSSSAGRRVTTAQFAARLRAESHRQQVEGCVVIHVARLLAAAALVFGVVDLDDEGVSE